MLMDVGTPRQLQGRRRRLWRRRRVPQVLLRPRASARAGQFRGVVCGAGAGGVGKGGAFAVVAGDAAVAAVGGALVGVGTRGGGGGGSFALAGAKDAED